MGQQPTAPMPPCVLVMTQVSLFGQDSGAPSGPLADSQVKSFDVAQLTSRAVEEAARVVGGADQGGDGGGGAAVQQVMVYDGRWGDFRGGEWGDGDGSCSGGEPVEGVGGGEEGEEGEGGIEHVWRWNGYCPI